MEIESQKYHSLSELDAISNLLSDYVIKFVPSLFSTVEYKIRDEDTLFVIRVPRKYLPKVKKRVTNWYFIKSQIFNNIKIEVRVTPGIE